MNMMSRLSTVFIVACATGVVVSPAAAQNVHSWISSTGSGNTCSRAAPCSSFSTAYTVTSAGGVISFLDPIEFGGAVTIDKSLTIRADGSDKGWTDPPTSGGAWINVAAGASNVVTLEGLHLHGGGITFYSGAHLHVVGCVITNQTTASSAILFQPNSASRLSVTDTVISNVGNGIGGGIIVNPRAGGSARVNLERVTVNGNAFGIAADGSRSTAGINMTIADSMIGGNAQDGVIATTSSGGAPIGLYLKNSKSINNAIGVRSLGANVTVRLDNTAVIGNGTGLSFGSGGALLTFGNNAVQANGSNGSFSGAVPLN